MLTRIGDEVVDKTIYKDMNNIEVLGGTKGTNYTVKGPDLFECEVLFQHGNPATHGVNGLTLEALLAILIHRTRMLDAAVPCNENAYATQHMEAALAFFDARTARRIVRQVHGKADL